MTTRRLLSLLALPALAFAVFAAPASAAADRLLAPATLCPSADELNLSPSAAQHAMLCLTNYARKRSGLPALSPNPALDEAGNAKLAADVSCREFSHTPCGHPFTDVFATYLKGAAGYDVGENIAWGTGAYGTPRQTMNSWLHSPEHRKNILTGRFRELGIGYLPNRAFRGYAGATLWSQEFGARS
jgi:uncharacterized protein YkwD